MYWISEEKEEEEEEKEEEEKKSLDREKIGTFISGRVFSDKHKQLQVRSRGCVRCTIANYRYWGELRRWPGTTRG